MDRDPLDGDETGVETSATNYRFHKNSIFLTGTAQFVLSSKIIICILVRIKTDK